MIDGLPVQPGSGGRPADVLTPLIVDLLRWLAAEPRTYPEVMDVWRTSCPRLTVWEDAVDAGYVARRRGVGGVLIDVTPRGLDLLSAAGRGA